MKKSILRLAVCGFVFAVMFLQLAPSQASAYSASVDKTQLTQGECLTLTWSGFGGTCNVRIYKGSTPGDYANTQAPYQGTQQICTSGWEIRNDYKIRVELKTNTTIYVYSQVFAVSGPKPYLVDFLVNGGAATTTSRDVFLQFNFTTSDPTHYIASENSGFSGASWTNYTGNNNVNFSLSSSTGTKTVYFKLKNAYGESSVKSDSISYAPILYCYISGYVRDGNGQGVNGVTLSGFPNGGITTSGNGDYRVENIISSWSGTITPSKTGYTFSPPSRSYNGLSGNMANQNFTAIPDTLYFWQTGAWGTCIDTCDGWKKTRTVQCLDSNEQSVSDSFCTGTKPAEESGDCPNLGPSRLDNSLGGEMYTAP